LSTR
jgi:hypothetical protein